MRELCSPQELRVIRGKPLRRMARDVVTHRLTIGGLHRRAISETMAKMAVTIDQVNAEREPPSPGSYEDHSPEWHKYKAQEKEKRRRERLENVGSAILNLLPTPRDLRIGKDGYFEALLLGLYYPDSNPESLLGRDHTQNPWKFCGHLRYNR